jgi:diaminopropionate ammonia-lyase
VADHADPLTRPWAANAGAARWTAAAAGEPGVAAFHRSIPGYRPTPLVALPALAAALGVRSLAVKDESDRFGLPAFKALGVSWAVNGAMNAHLGHPPAGTFTELVDRVRGSGLTLVTATDGNHGRALARFARLLGAAARVHVPAGLDDAALAAIAGEGATVVDTGGVYDDAVRDAAASTGGRPGDLLVQDSAWPGYEQVPGWVVQGYSTLFTEVDEQCRERPGLVVVPTGVGSLLQAAIVHHRAPGRDHRPAVLAVEPTTAACVTRSLRAGAPVTVDTAAPTVMAGLNCGTVSSTAWPVVRGGLDAAIGVTDEEARTAMADLHAAGVAAGPCGAAALAGVRAAAGVAELAPLLGPDVDVLLVSTEAQVPR